MGNFLSKNITVLLLIVLYRILLDYIYLSVTNPVFSYVGFDNNSTTTSTIVSWITLIILSLIVLPYFKSSDCFFPDLLIFLFLMRFIPFTVLIRFLDVPLNLSFLYFVYFALIFILTRIIKIPNIPLYKKNSKRSDDTILYLGVIFFAAIIIFISGYYASFRVHLSFDDVYDLRHEASDFNMPTIMRYAWSPATNILPLLFVYFMRRKKRLLCFIILLVIILNFSINGLKSTIFKLFICIFFGLIKINNFKPYYLPVFIFLLLLTILEGYIWDLRMVHDIVIRRALFIPPLLDTFYYDYFSQNPPMFYTRSGTPIQYIISEVYYGDPEIESNNGLFSDAILNLGFLGCIIYPFIYAVLFKICGKAFRGADKGIVVFASIIIAFGMASSELTTSLLTHGLFLFSIFMYLISMNNINYQKTN